jgi:uncharacterized protein YecT (DUF1311 family)
MNRTSVVRLIVVLSVLTLIAPHICTAQQGPKPKSCWATAKSQLAMSECAGSELKAAETKMAALLQKQAVSSENPAQKAWEAYRDAQLESIYPKENSKEFGSVFPMCFALLKTKLTEGRIRDLNALTTSGEGDVCYGLKSVAARQSNEPAASPLSSSPAEIPRRVSGNCSTSR